MSEDNAIIKAVQSAIDGALPGQDAHEAIRAYLKALEEMGLAVVPKVLTDEMKEATGFGITLHAWWDAVAASPKPPGADL